MKTQIALLVMLEESEIEVLEKLPKKELQGIQEQAAVSIQRGLVKLGLVEERKNVSLEESEQSEEGETISFILGNINDQNTPL